MEDHGTIMIEEFWKYGVLMIVRIRTRVKVMVEIHNYTTPASIFICTHVR
jgi:hypothetical protein